MMMRSRKITPGVFARAWLPVEAGAAGARLYVPAQALVKRAEMIGVYVVNSEGRPLLRLVRTGRTAAGRTEILSGLAAGERVALDPQAAARLP